jgi:hypothetical protein
MFHRVDWRMVIGVSSALLGLLDPEDEGSTFPGNTSNHLPVRTV